MTGLLSTEEHIQLLETYVLRNDKASIKKKLADHPELINTLESLAMHSFASDPGEDSLLYKIGELKIGLKAPVAASLQVALSNLYASILAGKLEVHQNNNIAEIAYSPDILNLMRKDGVLKNAMDDIASHGLVLTLSTLEKKLKNLAIDDAQGIVIPEIKPFLEEALEAKTQKISQKHLYNVDNASCYKDACRGLSGDNSDLEILENAGVAQDKINAFLKETIDKSIEIFTSVDYNDVEENLSREVMENLYKRVPEHLENKMLELAAITPNGSDPYEEFRLEVQKTIIGRFSAVRLEHSAKNDTNVIDATAEPVIKKQIEKK